MQDIEVYKSRSVYRRRAKSDEEAKELLRQIVQDGKMQGADPKYRLWKHKNLGPDFVMLHWWFVSQRCFLKWTDRTAGGFLPAFQNR